MTEWMRDTGNNGVTSEDYLLGKEVDKNFEQQGTMGQINAVEYDCTPESIFSSRAEHQVDLQRKIAEDPLVSLRKYEIEKRRKLMENPIKMKQLKAYIEKTKKERKKHKKEKKKKKKRSKSSDEEDNDQGPDDEEDLDMLLLKKMGHDVSEMEQNKAKKEEEGNANLEPIAGGSRGRVDDDSSPETKTQRMRKDRDRQQQMQRRSRSPPPRRRRSRSPPRKRRPSRSRSRSPDRQRQDQQRRRRSRSREKKSKKSSKSSLDESEREKRLREMMSNADWRESQRTKNVKHYREMDAKQETDERADKDPDFIRKQLEKAAASGSLEKRIQANRHHIQRGASSMDSNFARR